MDWIHLAQDRDQWRGCFIKHGDEPIRSIKHWKFLESVNNYGLLENASAARSQLVVAIST
jgi:hypothetical protein